jgi:hypothetical protein
MFMLFFGMAVIIGTVVLGAYTGKSWLCCWEGVGAIPEDPGEKGGRVVCVSRSAPVPPREQAFWGRAGWENAHYREQPRAEDRAGVCPVKVVTA